MPPKDLFAFIWHYTAPFKWLLLAGMIVSGLMAVIEVWVFDFIGNIVNWLAATNPGDLFADKGSEIILMIAIVAVLWPLFALIDDTVTHQGMLGNYAMQIRWRAHRYMLRQSISHFTDDFAGRLATKVMQTALGVREAVLKVTNLFVYVAVYVLGALTLFTASDIRLAIPTLIWIFVYAGLGWHFMPRLQKISQEQADARSGLTGRIVDAYSNIQTVKMFSSNEEEDVYAKEGMETMLDTVYRQMRQVTLLSFFIHLVNGILIASTLGLGLWLWSRGQVETGALAVSGALLMRLQGMSHWFLWEVAALFESIGSVQDGIETLSRPISITDPDIPKPFQVVHGEIAYKDVHFNYGKTEGDGVIADFNLAIKPGEKVGLIGRSGAGKSTLVNLLLRLYDTEKGDILIDNHRIVDISQEELRKNIAVVTQDTSLLHRSIRENIAYGRPEATEQEIHQAAELAEAWDFIPDLVDGKGRKGLDAHVGERGVKLSGGQRQRIAIARVILKDAPILVLDEATSALDSEAEAAIQQQLDQLMQGKTVIAIAHRLSTIAAMDRLIVIDKGEIKEQGTHSQLVAQDGIYASLWARQSGGFIAVDETEEQT